MVDIEFSFNIKFLGKNQDIIILAGGQDLSLGEKNNLKGDNFLGMHLLKLIEKNLFLFVVGDLEKFGQRRELFFVFKGFLNFSSGIVIGFVLRELLPGNIFSIDYKRHVIFDEEAFGKPQIDVGFIGNGSHFFIFAVEFRCMFLLIY